MFVENPFPTEEWCYYDGARLIAVGYVDQLAEGLSAIYFYYDPDERLDTLHHSLKGLDRKRNAVREKLYEAGTRLNGEIEQAKSQIEQVRALTNQRVQLYRQTNIRHRRLLPPPSFRKNAEFPPLHWWPEVSLNNHGEGA